MAPHSSKSKPPAPPAKPKAPLPPMPPQGSGDEVLPLTVKASLPLESQPPPPPPPPPPPATPATVADSTAAASTLAFAGRAIQSCSILTRVKEHACVTSASASARCEK